jgi:hypothetical protein
MVSDEEKLKQSVEELNRLTGLHFTLEADDDVESSEKYEKIRKIVLLFYDWPCFMSKA